MTNPLPPGIAAEARAMGLRIETEPMPGTAKAWKEMEMDAMTILENACEATNDTMQSPPQPYGAIVCRLLESDADAADALKYPDRILEVIARLLEAAHYGAPQ